MAEAQGTKTIDFRLRSPRARKDLLVIVAVSLFVFFLSYFFDVFVFIVRFLEKHPRKIIYVDEVITGLLTLSIAFAVFSWRRWAELTRETAARRQVEEELLRIADTRAATERIISRQLRCEIELRREKEKALLSAKQKIKKQAT